MILTAALSVPWIRMRQMVRNEQLEIANQLAEAWLSNIIQLGTIPSDNLEADEMPELRFNVMPISRAELLAEQGDKQIADALTHFQDQQFDEPLFWFNPNSEDENNPPVSYRYIKPLSYQDMTGVRDPRFARYDLDINDPQIANPLWGILIIEQSAANATRQLIINRAYIILSGLLAGLLAILVFYFITMRLILSPVRVLRETAERVSKGDLYIRSDISTGDEFEELSDTFNLMLSNLKASQDQLRQMNKTLDLKLNELSKSNVMLHEANRLKNEFLANVSHELRTPLNSIIGFTEVLQEHYPQMEDEIRNQKNQRYIQNILISGRSLLEMINDLLDLAKIEAGRMEINPEPTDLSDVCESLVTLIRPQARIKSITLELSISRNLPIVETDSMRFQQVIFNFLSNAVKFTPEHGVITLSVKRIRDTEIPDAISVSVTDTGPGLNAEDQAFIFEKFRQVDASHTRKHAGTGLGLAICKELAILLDGRIELHSIPGQGATFSLIMPKTVGQERPQSLM